MRPTKKLVFMAVCDDASKDTRVSYPGLEKIMLWSRLTKRPALSTLSELITDGYLYRLAGGYAGRRVEYLVFPTPEEIESLNAYFAAVDNSPKKGAPMSTQQILKGAEKLRKGAEGSTPPVNTPGDEEIEQSSVQGHHGGPVENSDDDVINSPRLGFRGGIRHRRLTRSLDVDGLLSFAAPIVEAIDEPSRERVIRMLAYEILAVPAAANEQVFDPTRYVLGAFNRDRHRWTRRALQVDVALAGA